MGLFNKIKKLNIFSGLFSVDEDFFEELEESLILSDMGMETTLEAVETLRERVKERKIKEPEEVKACLREILVEMLAVGEPSLDLSGKPAVILMIGVNGVGKTTTIGKLANRLKADGNRVLLAAGDTYSLGSTGGQAEHTLTVQELPSHGHGYTYTGQSSTTGTGAIRLVNPGGTVNAYTGEKDGRTGGGQPHSNMPPYLAVNIWRRTA